MGIQPRDLADATMGPPVTLIRHAYTRPEHQGGEVSERRCWARCRNRLTARVLIGTWAAGDWAIKFYQGKVFALIADTEEKDRLLRSYWFCEVRLS